jgi:hypothetical protein
MSVGNEYLRQVRYKATTFGTPAGAAGAQKLRRVRITPQLQKATYQSDEIVPSRQVTDLRHGTRKVSFNLEGRLSPGTYEDFFANGLQRDFTTISNITGLSLTITGSSNPYTVARGSGSWLTDGIKIGQVVRISAAGLHANNSNKNLLVTGVTALNLTVRTLNASAMNAEGPIASSTCSVPGKVDYAPTSGHTTGVFDIEDWSPDVPSSEVYQSCVCAGFNVDMPATGLVGCGFQFMGKDLSGPNASEYFTTPTDVTASGLASATTGVLLVNGAAIATCTGLNFKGAFDPKTYDVIASLTTPAIDRQMMVFDGEVTVLFDSTTLVTAFVNETVGSLLIAAPVNGDANSEFVAFTLPTLKFTSADNANDGPGRTRVLKFTSIQNTAGGAGIATENTSFYMQDSLA